MIKVFQPGLMPLGHFDVVDSDLANIEGGEVLVFDTAPAVAGEQKVPDVYSDDNRANLRLATITDNGPFFFAGMDKNNGQFTTPGFERTSAFSTNSAFGQSYDSSSKISIYASEGFYSITLDRFVDGYVTENTAPNTRLYVGESGLLTTEPSTSSALVGFFIEYRKTSILNNNLNRPFYTAGSHKEQDSVIVYKSNADGYFSINLISEVIGTVGSIGTPTDGNYDTGFFDFAPSTTIANAVDDVNELLLLIAPATPANLTGKNLVISGSDGYSAILPSGLPSTWYSDGYSAGDEITTYIVDPTYTLRHPDQANSFNGGKISNPSEMGRTQHILDDLPTYFIDLPEDGVSTNGTLSVTDISTYNNIWNKINAEINYTHTTDGITTHALYNSLAGTTNVLSMFYDPVNTAPSFDTGVSVSENTPVDGYLSGIIHYATNSTFDVSYTAASGIFNRAYHPTEVSRIEVPGGSNFIVNPSSIPAYTDTFEVTNETITLDSANVARESPSVTARLFKPNGITTSDTAALLRPVNTFGTISTTTAEYFVDEAQRLFGLNSTSPDWTSSDPLVDGYAQVRITGSNGVLGFPNSVQYPGFVEAEQVYQRHFTKVVSSNGTLTFSGIDHSDIDSYDSGGDLNVLLRLDSDGKWFDLGRLFADNGTGDGSGDSLANAIGAKTIGSGGVVNFTFTTFTTGNNSNKYRIYIVFRNSNHSITQIIAS